MKKVDDEGGDGRQQRHAGRLASLNADHLQALNWEVMSYFVSSTVKWLQERER